MRLLIDTSVFIRVGNPSVSLSASIRKSLIEAEAVFVSSLVRAEIAIKLSIGKLTLPTDEQAYWKEMTSRLQAQELPFAIRHAALLSKLPLHHRDPFDRMIAVQCLADDFTLATTDPIFLAYGVRFVA